MLCMTGVLGTDDLVEVVAEAERLHFVDGRATAGWHAKAVKRNLQADRADPGLAALRGRLQTTLMRHPLFQLAARPKALSPIILSRYEDGMSYGAHVDDALMGGMRTDLSFTLFLSEPDAYDGGALVIEGAIGEQPVKLGAGALVLYPSTALHRVEPVTRGARLAAVGWVRSYVRDPAERELLFELDSARRVLFERHGKTAEFDAITRCSTNLLRMWADD